MKNVNKLVLVLILLVFLTSKTFAQQNDLQGINNLVVNHTKTHNAVNMHPSSAGVVQETNHEELLQKRLEKLIPLPAYEKKMGDISDGTDSFCTPTYTYGCSEDDGFTDFAVEQIQNYGSDCADLNGTGWSEYYSLGPAMLYPGMVHTFTMRTGYSNQHVNIWIDFNDDLTLSTDEIILNDYIMPLAAVLYDVDVTIPANATAGQHAMRAMSVWDNAFTDACGSYDFGEAEDYTVIIGDALFGDLEGYVTELDGGAPVFDALISVGGIFSGTTDADGFYHIDQVITGMWDVSCTKEGYNLANAPVTILEDVTSNLGFQLTQPQFIVTPLVMTQTLEPNTSNTQTINYNNTGNGSVDWTASLSILSDNDAMKAIKGSQAYAVQLTPDPTAVVSFDTEDPGNFTNISSTSLDPFAGDFDNANSSILYCITYTTNQLYAIDVTSGTETLIANVTGVTGGHSVSGMACDKTTGIMYVSSTNITASDIYTVNLSTGELTLIGSTGIPGIIEIAIDGTGTMYGWDIVNDEAFTIDKVTGTSTLLGPLGVDLNYAQGGNWDPVSDVIYLAAYSTSGQLMTMDKITGALTIIGAFPDGAEIDALAFPGGYNNWISINQQYGTLGAGNSGQMTVSFDATDLIPGIYEAEIHFGTNPNVGSPVVDVTLTVVGFIPATNLNLNYDCTDVELTWDMAAGGDPDSWNVYKDGILLGNSTIEEYTDEMVMPNVEYGYYVKAVYAGEESMPTITKFITVPLPTNLLAMGLGAIPDLPEENDVTLTWDAPTACVAPDGYDVYRDGDQINSSLVTTLTYVDQNLLPGLYEYYIVAVYYFGESAPSVPVYSLITGVEDNDSDMFRVYPNPSSAVINIESSIEINGIQIFNNAGQLVIDKSVNVNQYQINVSQFEKGIYYIKLETAEGKMLRKITVN
jgi:hypothetical protein